MPALDVLRRIRFRPYCKRSGPTFSLTIWDTNRRDGMGKSILGYRLVMRTEYWSDPPESYCVREDKATLFDGEDFGCSPLHCVDSDETVAGIMGFLTLRPGDTDPEYFADYTPEQLSYCSAHAEALACEVSSRFGDL